MNLILRLLSLVLLLQYVFGDLCKKDPVISNHPSDFSLVWIGSFNCVSGSVISLDEPQTVAQATDFFTAE